MCIGGGLAAAVFGLLPARTLAARPPIVSNIALAEGRVWIAATIGDNGPYLFAIDTGADVSLIHDNLAKSLKLKPRGRGMMAGLGGVSEMIWYNGGDVVLGNGVRFPNMLFGGTSARIGRDAAGTFGAGLFTTYDSDLDFAAGEWRAYVDGRPDRDGFRPLKSRFISSRGGGARILADASLGEFAGEFLLDTGAPSEVSLDAKATERSGLWRDDRPYAPMRARGIGREAVPTRLIRMDRMRIGPFIYEQPLVTLMKPGSGGAKVEEDGIIGLGALRRLHLSTEVGKGILWAAPNGLDLPPSGYPKSGLWVKERSGGLEIEDVGTSSPAFGAGLRRGDLIVGERLSDFVGRITAPAGTIVAFDYERGGKRSRAEFTLAPYL